MANNNNKGFSLIELIVIVAILAVAAGTTIASLRTMFQARSYKATKSIDGMISQSKINAMSGKKNTFILRYDEAKECYICELKDVNDVVYESEEIGNNQLDVIVDGVDVKNVAPGLVISFNMDTGAVKSFTKGSGHSVDWVDGTASGREVITLKSYTTHSITLYKSTGEHYFE